MCYIGEISIDKYIGFLKNYRKEDSYMVLLDIFGSLKSVYNLFSKDGSFDCVWPKYREVMIEPFGRVFKRLGWAPKKGESHEDAMLRALAIGYLGFAKDKGILKASMEKFRKSARGKDVIPPDLKGTVYALVADNFPKSFGMMMKAYEKSKNLEDKQKLLAALYRFRTNDAWEMMEYSISPNVRAQDLRTVFSVMESNPAFSGKFFKWTRKRWKKLEGLQKSHSIFIDFIEALIGFCVWSGEEKAVNAFLSSKKVKYNRTRSVSLEVLENRRQFMKKNGPLLKKHFGFN
jgi:hypothetical protein